MGQLALATDGIQFTVTLLLLPWRQLVRVLCITTTAEYIMMLPAPDTVARRGRFQRLGVVFAAC
jgi:hypothetical protein